MRRLAFALLMAAALWSSSAVAEYRITRDHGGLLEDYKAKYAVIIFGAIELFSGVANIPGDNVAHFAHLGGLLFGLIYIWIWKKWSFRRFN